MTWFCVSLDEIMKWPCFVSSYFGFRVTSGVAALCQPRFTFSKIAWPGHLLGVRDCSFKIVPAVSRSNTCVFSQSLLPVVFASVALGRGEGPVYLTGLLYQVGDIIGLY